MKTIQQLRTVASIFATVMITTLFFVACNQEEDAVAPEKVTAISQEVKDQFTRLGFDVSDIARDGKNYVLEGDIVVTPTALSNMLASDPVIVDGPEGEQYRTFNLVDRNLSTIRITTLKTDAKLSLAVNRAIKNYNDLNLTFKMVRVFPTEEADITIFSVTGRDDIYAGRAGFPTGNGLPFDRVEIDDIVFAFGDDVATEVITHEIGHCLGLRHSDWYNRSLSCGGPAINEEIPPSGDGAIRIPGTPMSDPNSVMKACARPDDDGEFSFYDRKALRELY